MDTKDQAKQPDDPLDGVLCVSSQITSDMQKLGIPYAMEMGHCIDALPPEKQLEIEHHLNTIVGDMPVAERAEYLQEVANKSNSSKMVLFAFQHNSVFVLNIHQAAITFLKWLQSYTHVRIFNHYTGVHGEQKTYHVVYNQFVSNRTPYQFDSYLVYRKPIDDISIGDEGLSFYVELGGERLYNTGYSCIKRLIHKTDMPQEKDYQLDAKEVDMVLGPKIEVSSLTSPLCLEMIELIAKNDLVVFVCGKKHHQLTIRIRNIAQTFPM
jgi:hypothetical protein